MKRRPIFSMLAWASLVALALGLSGCGALDRLAQVGQTPPLTQIQDPTARPGYRPVRMPMPTSAPVQRAANSIWRQGSRAFFKDQRASNVGDILTIVIDINDKAKISNTTTRTRTNSENSSASAIFGFEGSLKSFLPKGVNPTNLLDLDSSSSNSGGGTVNRDEEIELKVAAVITQILPNGNMVIHGRQEMRINFEIRELQVAGVIRPEDITSTNTIKFEQIAEARIAYGGRGHITDVQQPRYGQQVLDIILPF